MSKSQVSIPFIAGQWSLRTGVAAAPTTDGGFQSPSLRGSGRFTRVYVEGRRNVGVSIPFIAGQWSLQIAQNVGEHVLVKFQSPSLRGSGRFRSRGASPRVSSSSFNPLHCGAVVASWKPCFLQWRRSCFNPLHCGAVVASRRGGWDFNAPPVSIPFIAGQWSLLAHCRLSPLSGPSFNPLHCGAVVASRRRGGSGPDSEEGFNPLHCGAVVASSRSDRAGKTPPPVFQSPSLRGSGRFPLPYGRGGRGLRVSIPFIAGQWSLRPSRMAEAEVA